MTTESAPGARPVDATLMGQNPAFDAQTDITEVFEVPNREFEIPKGYRLDGRVVFTGHPGTGKGTIEKIFQESYDLSDDQIIRTGDKYFRNDEVNLAFQDRPVEKDIKVDREILDMLNDPDPEKTFILESRTAAVLRKLHPKSKRKSTVPVKTFLFTAPAAIRLERAARRDMAKDPSLSFPEARRQTISRQDRDLRRLQRAHPRELTGINPMSAGIFYDHVVHTNTSPEEVAYRIHNLLVADGIVRLNEEAEMRPEKPTERRNVSTLTHGEPISALEPNNNLIVDLTQSRQIL